ncbi:MAG: hypothetical protein ACJ73S_03470 [Mycobacteriales bacterium]
MSWPTAVAAFKPLSGIAARQTVVNHPADGGTGQAALTRAPRFADILSDCVWAVNYVVLST